jgi:diguanylate cyclase (GGDEF)-like protein
MDREPMRMPNTPGVARRARSLQRASGTPKRAPQQLFSLSTKKSLSGALDPAVMPRVSQEELWSMAFTDDLTSLLNRRGFLLLANQQLKMSRRSVRGGLLFFVDLDELKQINDHFGHGEGDAALVLTGQILRETFRDSDLIGRFGGDEFLILASEISEDSEAIILRRLQEGISNANTKEHRYTYSFRVGVARFDPRSPCPLDDLIAQADGSLYEQKNQPKEQSILDQPIHRRMAGGKQ